MQEIIELIGTYLRQVLSRQKLVVPIALVLSCAGWAWVYRMPDLYLAQTQILVDARSFLDELLKGMAVEQKEGTPELIELARATLTTRSTVERVARETDLDLNGKSPKQIDAINRAILDRINVRSVGGTTANQLVIEYEDTSPRVAQVAVQTLLNVLIDTSLGSSRSDAKSSEEFIQQQITEYETKLSEAEQRLSDFKQKNMGLLPEEGQTYFTQLQAVRDSVQNTRLELQESQQQRDQLKARIEEFRNPTNGSTTPIVSDRVRELQAKLDDLLLRFTDKHPEVISTRQQIALLTDPNRQANAAADNGKGPTSLDLITGQLMVELTRADAKVASVSTRLAELQRRQQSLEGAMNTIPKVAAELQNLTRDYEINRKQYESLVAKRESARLSREAGLREESQFKVIEAPHTSPIPVSPKRLLLNTAVPVVAWGIAAAFAILLGELTPTIGRSQQLSALFPYPVLGSIGRVTKTVSPLLTYSILIAGVGLSVVLYVLVALSSLGVIRIG